MEKRNIPTATIVSTAFITPARLAARNLQLDALPLIVVPHPLNDLTPGQVGDLARSAYPLILLHLTGQEALEPTVHADYVRPERRKVAGNNRQGGVGGEKA